MHYRLKVILIRIELLQIIVVVTVLMSSTTEEAYTDVFKALKTKVAINLRVSEAFGNLDTKLQNAFAKIYVDVVYKIPFFFYCQVIYKFINGSF